MKKQPKDVVFFQKIFQVLLFPFDPKLDWLLFIKVDILTGP